MITDTTDRLKEITDLGMMASQLDSEIENLEAQLADKIKQREKILGDSLPTMMLDLNLRDFTLQNGRKCKFMTIYKAKIPDEYKTKAFEWLRSTGNDAIIKDLLKFQFAMGEVALADAIVENARALGVNYERDTNVHPKTLESFVKEKIDSGDIGFPQEIFGVKTFNRVTLK